ncbi:MAG TPA: ATP-dependent RNA helicase, partial [Spirochaetales bacterium]|nr:ATP-dependent RNA helicase [Spirochaetales bacterium]
VILYEAGYAAKGIIGVTQPRRIAALSVSEFIAKQLSVDLGTLVGYKMRFEDKTDFSTKIKIMTDGILLQEMKLDPMMLRYNVMIVDEAHERSLNIDFILGLLKRVLEARPEFKVIISSATINADIFSSYFGDCPVVKIDTITYPVTLVYDPPSVENNMDVLLEKIVEITARTVASKRIGDILIFLPGEKAIKDCISLLSLCKVKDKLHIIPLYARLGKDEQERVFEEPPLGKVKVVVSTNIAETSVTIDGVTTVIDSGLAKLNFYNPKTFTSSLIEVPISKASANQRKGRAGRTAPGYCYRLYTREDFEGRALFTMEEIYRTDLSEVVLRMAELGITDFERFDFISKPGRSGIIGAIEILNLLDALNPDRTLSSIGTMMCAFPLLPRLSRMIVEAMLKYPDVLEEILIAAAFLSTQSPYVLPPGEEIEARSAHHAFRDRNGDFVSYLKLFKAFVHSGNKTKFCETNYLDERTMLEIVRIKEQIELIVHEQGMVIGSGGPVEHYLTAVGRGLIQFVCIKEERGLFRTLMGERVLIHP